MIDEELDPQTDPVMARLRRARPAHLREMPSATDPAAQALMKEITMNNTTLERNPATTDASGGSTGSDNGDTVISLEPRRRNRLLTVAAAAVLAVGAVGASIAIQSGSSATDRVHAAAMETREVDSGVVRIEATIVDTDFVDGEPFELDMAATMRFDGDDSSFEQESDGADGGSLRSVTVDGRVYSTGLNGEWQDLTDLSGAQDSTPTSTSVRFDEVLADLERLDGYSQDGTELVDGVETTRYRATAQEGELSGSAIAAFAVTPAVTDIVSEEPVDGLVPTGPVEYTVWIDGDGVIARLRAQASDETSSFVTDARFSELGVPQTIEAPEDFTVVDPTVPELFEVMAAAPEAVLDACIPDVQMMSDLSAADFDGLVSCLRDGGADEAADIFADLGPAGLDAAVASVSGDVPDDN